MVLSKKDALKLNDFEVFISMIKFNIATSMFQRPYLYVRYGIINGLVADVFMTYMAITSNSNLIKCMNMMPKRLTQPETRLTYGKVVSYILDNRDQRLERDQNIGNSSFYIDMVDVMITTSSFLCSVSYIKYAIT